MEKTFESVRNKEKGGYGPQSTSRTLIDCLDVYLTTPPYEKNTIFIRHDKGLVSMHYRGPDKVTIFHIEDCPNVQCCYEELLDFIIEKAFRK